MTTDRIEFTRPSAAYRRSAWLASIGLALFVALYLSLAGWFVWAAWHAFFVLLPETNDGFFHVVTGAMAAFMGFFMLKALVFIKRGASEGLSEVTAADQPELFRFLHDIADRVAAPRPHKVFVSARVNAAVFYDLSLLSFLLPARKNLEIGLGLVNSLSLGEFRAVVAHEFGHFAQRSMAVGRWVYVAQQIAGHLVARRDALDRLLRSLSHSDLRIAWIGWIVSLLIWAVRALIDWAFTLLVRVQRSLSREMEFNADLVAVSLTGSDALINALHCLQGADDAWDRAAAFAMRQRAQKRMVPDLFALQSTIRDRLGVVRDEAFFGKSPPVPHSDAAAYRLFHAEAAQPPRMWMTHPFNHEREANAKRDYRAAAIDGASAWEIFADSASLRERVTAELLSPAPEAAVAMTTAEAVDALNRQFSVPHLDPRYQGIYFGRSLTRHVSDRGELIASAAELREARSADFYRDGLREEVQRLRALEVELAQLRGIDSGALQLDSAVAWRNGKPLQPQEVKDQLAATAAERDAVRARLFRHDRLVRGRAVREAEAAGQGWGEALKGLLSFIHYGEHGEANIGDLQQRMWRTVHRETATRKVSSSGCERIVEAAGELYQALARLYQNSGDSVLAPDLQAALGASSLPAMWGEFTLNPPSADNINDWLGIIESWADHATGLCRALSGRALDLLLSHEETLHRHQLEGTSPGPAPAASRAPDFDLLLEGRERKAPQGHDWWVRFQLGDGHLAATARLVAAVAIVGAIVFVVNAPDDRTRTLLVFNGLDRDVTVEIGGHSDAIRARSYTPVQLPRTWTDETSDRHRPIGDHEIITRTRDGSEIERVTPIFTESGYSKVYNVAASLPLVQWTAVYGRDSGSPEPRLVAQQRFFATSISYVFTKPPRSMSVRGGGSTSVEVLEAPPLEVGPAALVRAVKDPDARANMIRAHARWDTLSKMSTTEWLYYAADLPDFEALVAARLRENPDEMVLRRLAQDSARPEAKEVMCQQAATDADRAPNDATLRYLAIRCQSEGQQDSPYREAFRRWPDNPWLTLANAYVETHTANWAEAGRLLRRSLKALPGMVGVQTAEDLVRVERMASGSNPPDIAELASQSVNLRHYIELEQSGGADRAPGYWQKLWKGQLDTAFESAPSDPEEAGPFLYVLAASETASEAIRASARAIQPRREFGVNVLLYGAATALREGRDSAPCVEAMASTLPPGFVVPARTFLSRASRQDIAGAEAALAPVPPSLRGVLYAAGVVLLEDKAPRSWRQGASRLLFVSERPWFRPAAD
ncbi:MAG: M48 family metallopeptidase [Alphaproteobacteria bacterium]|nr:M48 family metallopeptidase [Alphaproteobacteria bacterium]